MPELPEVETTKNGLNSILPQGKLEQLNIYCHQFRLPIDHDLPKILRHRQLIGWGRRGKYLLFHFEHGTLIAHLGMSGSIRRCDEQSFRLKHDHVEWIFKTSETNNETNTITLRLNDPRRFGLVVWHPQEDGDVNQHKLFAKLGVEPFSHEFTWDYLWQGLQKTSRCIKPVLLDGHVVVGVGNIYCSEALFLAQINPIAPANKISKAQVKKLHACIISTLQKAIEAGGSTMRDYSGVDGKAGAYFDMHAKVYGRDTKPCHTCATPITKITQGQRATFFCPKCQNKPATPAD